MSAFLNLSEEGVEIDVVDVSPDLIAGGVDMPVYGPIPLNKEFRLNYIVVSSVQPFKSEGFIGSDPIYVDFGEGQKPGIKYIFPRPKKLIAGESLNFTNTNISDPDVGAPATPIYTTISGVLYDV